MRSKRREEKSQIYGMKRKEKKKINVEDRSKCGGVGDV